MNEIDLYEEDTELSDLTEFDLDAPTRGPGRPRSVFKNLQRTDAELATIELTRASIEQAGVENVLGIKDGIVYAESKTGKLLTCPIPDMSDSAKIRSFATVVTCRPDQVNWTIMGELDPDFAIEVRAASRATHGW